MHIVAVGIGFVYKLTCKLNVWISRVPTRETSGGCQPGLEIVVDHWTSPMAEWLFLTFEFEKNSEVQQPSWAGRQTSLHHIVLLHKNTCSNVCLWHYFKVYNCVLLFVTKIYNLLYICCLICLSAKFWNFAKFSSFLIQVDLPTTDCRWYYS